MLAEIGHHRWGRFVSQIFAYRRHASGVTAIDTPVPAIAPMAARRQAAASADCSAVLPIRLTKVSAVSDVGLVIHIFSPRMARVAKELSSLGGRGHDGVDREPDGDRERPAPPSCPDRDQQRWR